MKTRNWCIALILSLSGLMLSGCGNGSGMTPGSTQVTVNFPNVAPAAVATRSGTSSFTTMTPSNQITISLPAGTTSYAIAYVCPPPTAGAQGSSEHVIEATTQDTTSITLGCLIFPPATFGTATGSLSSTISGTAAFQIFARLGIPALGPGSFPPGPFSVNLPTGTNDVAVVAMDGSNNIVGINILRGQSVPGALNAGSGIVVSDATVPQQVTVNNVPAGFNVSGPTVQYATANGTNLSLASPALSNPRPYAAIPAAQAQSGDRYFYEAISGNPSTLQAVEAFEIPTNGGGAVTLSLPAPWTFSGPVPEKLPSFTFNYSGFSGQPFVTDFASITWSNGSLGSNGIDVTATPNFLSGATNITFPDLSALPGFFGTPASGTTINWVARIESPTTSPFTGTTPTGTSRLAVANSGEYIQP